MKSNKSIKKRLRRMGTAKGKKNPKKKKPPKRLDTEIEQWIRQLGRKFNINTEAIR